MYVIRTQRCGLSKRRGHLMPPSSCISPRTGDSSKRKFPSPSLGVFRDHHDHLSQGFYPGPRQIRHSQSSGQSLSPATLAARPLACPLASSFLARTPRTEGTTSLSVSSSLCSGSASRDPALCSGWGSSASESDPCGRLPLSHGQLLGKKMGKKERIFII